MAYTDIDDPSAYFQTKLYTGTRANLNVTFDGNSDMSPNLVWVKDRTNTNNQIMFDSVRGINKAILPNAANAETTYTDSVTAFNSDGFTLGDDDEGQCNVDGNACASWNWKEQAGVFDIVSYTGNATSGATISHNLGVVPTMMIVKCRSVAGTNWIVYTAATGNTHWMYLNATNAAGANSAAWNNTSPTASQFSLGNDGDVNGNGRTYIAYLFGNKQGMSKVGSYTGNGNADGTFVYTGFKPAFVIAKQSSAAGQGWGMWDNKRSPSNYVDLKLFANVAEAESDEGAAGSLDFLSNGFKWRSSFGSRNGSGVTYIYMAFAENPFVTSAGVPATAR